MSRKCKNWLHTYLDYTAGTEAPKLMHFWTGVSTLAGVLKRRVWIDMRRFKWLPNFYIIFVARPGIVSKTTTMDLGMDLLKEVPGINFGPDVVTWQALVTRFAECTEMFQYEEDFVPMSAMTLASGELGNLINPRDPDMINAYIALWDGRKSFEKGTKHSGNDMVSAPWINMIGCTTPNWLAENMPQVAVGGGFTSRCVFVYADRKVGYIAYPDEHITSDVEAALRADLIADLVHINETFVGPFTLEEPAREWGRAWYEHLWKVVAASASSAQVEGFLTRKQTHLHKLAMILSAAERDDRVITKAHLELANVMLTETEKDLNKVFAKIGRSDESLHAERLLEFIAAKQSCTYEEAFRHVYSLFPNFKDFSGVLEGLIRSGQIRFDMSSSPDPTKARLVFITRE